MVVKLATEPSTHAPSLAEALARYGTWSHVDPYPEVAPSLLSQIEIEDYIRRTGLVFPYDNNRLKTASYEGRIGERVFIYTPKGERREILRDRFKGGYLRVPANSIVFVESDLDFHLPLYIGLRFNLQILHVHRGLLLGTGPLIDPGFSGKILIPLHNLTSRPHYIHKDEGLIWIEFTKTTYDILKDTEKKVKFPEYKKDKDSEYWINKASKDNYNKRTVPIETSIPTAILEAENSAKLAQDTRKYVETIGLLAIFGLFIAGMVFYETYFRATYEKVDGIEEQFTNALFTHRSELAEIRREIEAMREHNVKLQRAADESLSPTSVEASR